VIVAHVVLGLTVFARKFSVCCQKTFQFFQRKIDQTPRLLSVGWLELDFAHPQKFSEYKACCEKSWYSLVKLTR